MAEQRRDRAYIFVYSKSQQFWAKKDDECHTGRGGLEGSDVTQKIRETYKTRHSIFGSLSPN